MTSTVLVAGRGDDSDVDNIRLYLDVCLNTPEGEEVLLEGDLIGCSASQRDEDADGVMTDIDVCPGNLCW